MGASSFRRRSEASRSASSPRQSAVQRSNIPLARVALSAACFRVGRKEVRRKATVSSVPTSSTAVSVANTRPKESQPSLPYGAPWIQLLWIHSRPPRLPTRKSRKEIGTQAARPSAT